MIFGHSRSVNELATKFARQSLVLNEISTNAAIAAGHAGTESKVFSEIAKQIGLISAMLVERVDKVHERSSVMSNQALRCIVMTSHKEKFTASALMIDASSNFDLVNQVSQSLEQEIEELLRQVDHSVALFKPEQESISLVIDRIWSIIINLRVSSGIVIAEEVALFDSISMALGEMIPEVEKLLERLFAIVEAIRNTLVSECHCIRGVKKNAA